MRNLQALEKEIEKALSSISQLKKEKQQLLNRIRELQVALKEVDKLKSQNNTWQKEKSMIKLKIEKILNNLEVFK